MALCAQLQLKEEEGQEMNKLLQSRQSEVAQLRKDLEMQRGAHEELKCNMDSTQSSLQDRERALSKKGAETVSLQGDLERLRTSLTQTRQELSTLKQQLDAEKMECRELRSTLRLARTQEGRLEGLKTQLQEKERLVSDLEDLKTELQEKERLVSDLEDLKTELQEKERLVSDLEDLLQLEKQNRFLCPPPSASFLSRIFFFF